MSPACPNSHLIIDKRKHSDVDLYEPSFSCRLQHQVPQPAIEKRWQDDLYAYIGGIIREHKGTLLCVGGVADHVHLLAKLSPTVAVSDTLRLIKTNSSKMVNEALRPRIPFQWQTGYAAFSVSESQFDRVRDYIQNQEEHHRKRTFQDELIQLLQKHKITYDARFVFEQDIIE